MLQGLIHAIWCLLSFEEHDPMFI
uniref:Uncharacterized protein n=1 Tax=Anguilla anguilla TaxID=7936 RepID=A0A0E9TGF2_ANGAN